MDDGATLESDLIDVTDIDLERLDGLPDSVLVASLRRILAERAEQPDLYAGFQSTG